MFNQAFPFQAPLLPHGPQPWPAPPPVRLPSTTPPGTLPTAPTAQPWMLPPAPQQTPFPPVAPLPAPSITTPSVMLSDGSETDVLAKLLGAWSGKGFNAIWVPNVAHGHFLMLDRTLDEIRFDDIVGPIPNRGLLQPDIFMRGITYFQQIRNEDTNNTMHIEPGLWATVPQTTHPHVGSTIARLGSIPHGTTMLAQGLVSFGVSAPIFPQNDIVPFAVGSPTQRVSFEEADLSQPSGFRSKSQNVTPALVLNPNSFLQDEINKLAVENFIRFDVTTDGSVAPGGGVSNTAFLQGVPGEAPNAFVQKVASTLWIITTKTQAANETVLMYSQTVLLNFAGLSWPHVTVGVLRR